MQPGFWGTWGPLGVVFLLDTPKTTWSDVLFLWWEILGRKVDILGQEPVIWDHALHFLIREPHEDMCARVIYKGRSRYERDVRLLSDKTEFQVKGKHVKGHKGHDRKVDGHGVPTSPTDGEDGKPIPTPRTGLMLKKT
jgi:hypothetical protein